ncbi:MAG: hypothetical protein ACAI38_20170 [Myxococcota bacterium]
MKRLLVAVAIGLAACGSEDEVSDPSEFDHPGTRPMTVCADASSEDAFVLALRYQTDIRYNDRLASDYAWALNSARAAYPELCEPRAFADVSPDVIVARSRHPSIVEAWRDGFVETGVEDVDRILARVGVTTIERAPHSQAFVLTLAQPVNARALARALDRTRAVDAEAKEADDGHEFYFDGREYVSRSPSDIVVRSGERATRFIFERENGSGRASVVVHHNGVVGDLDDD